MPMTDGAMPRPLENAGRVRAAATKPLCVVVAACLLASGCTTMVSYAPQTSNPAQTIKYAQGMGTLVEKNEAQEIFMYPTFRAQGTAQPTFTIGYGSNLAQPVDFGPDNVKAYFRGVPVPIYTHLERITEIEGDKRGKQVALAVVGVLLAGAAVYGASRQTYTTNYSGYTSGRGGVRSYSGSESVRVYDPVGGILAGALVGGAAVVGVRQLEYNAGNEEAAARSILQANTVEPLQLVTGDLILKDCCDPAPRPDDVLRFEVSVGGRTANFEFLRNQVKK